MEYKSNFPEEKTIKISSENLNANKKKRRFNIKNAGYVFLTVLILLKIADQIFDKIDRQKSFEMLYNDGVQSYNEKNFEMGMIYVEDALNTIHWSPPPKMIVLIEKMYNGAVKKGDMFFKRKAYESALYNYQYALFFAQCGFELGEFFAPRNEYERLRKKQKKLLKILRKRNPDKYYRESWLRDDDSFTTIWRNYGY